MNRKLSFVLVIFTIAMLAGCEKNLKKSSKIQSADTLPPVVIKDTRIYYSDSLKVQMELKAPKIIEQSQIDTPYTEFPKGVEVKFFGANQKVESSLQANYSVYYRERDLWEYKGNVQLMNEQGDKLYTEHLYANRKEEKIYSTDYVSIKSPDGTEVNGAGGFESNLRFTEYQFKDVSGKINN